MAASRKSFTTQRNTGFGEKSTLSGGRFYRKDGKPNVLRKGIPVLDRYSLYHTMISMPRWKFWSCLLLIYILLNCFFAAVYYLIGVQNLVGIDTHNAKEAWIESFFFSAQTFTTVGYGHVSPSGILTSSVASFEAFVGVLCFALACGLFYGRFARPRSFLKFSENALLSPYKDGVALMLRTAPYKNNLLIDAEVKLTLALRVLRNGEEKNEFYSLDVEIDKVNALVLNWTIVHPINEDSPIYGMSMEEMKQGRAEVLVLLKAYDEGFSNTVVARTSYTASEIVEGARFRPMYTPSSTGAATLLHLERLNHFDRVPLDGASVVLEGENSVSLRS